jgi:murein DD-endopeptidase MepM/ murein hydrolase activator NlpD
MRPAADLLLAGTLATAALHAPLAAAAARPAILPAWAGSHPRFGWSGAWLFPVGDAYEIGRPGPDGSPAFRINRCIGGEESERHDGADLSCGRGGDLVRAASHGLVVVAEASGWNGGFGRHVVIAHRIPDGTLAYSVYAHLADQSLRVRKGQLVAAGQPIGRVGRSGRASSPHLHFEVRLATTGDEPWQKAEVQDPVTFVMDHLPAGGGEVADTAPYYEWAQCTAALAGDVPADSALDRGTWWRMMAHAAKQSCDEMPTATEDVRRILIEAGVLADAAPAAAPKAPPPATAASPVAPSATPPAAASAVPATTDLTWSEMARDLRRLRKVGVMVARPPIPPATHRARCEKRFGTKRPSQALDTLAVRRKPPRVGDACMMIADLSSTWEIPKKKVAKPAARDSVRAPAPAPKTGMRAGGEVDAGPR